MGSDRVIFWLDRGIAPICDADRVRTASRRVALVQLCVNLWRIEG